jgi:hypothetical protein
MTKRVFRTNRVSITNTTGYNGWTPPQHEIMSELLEFLITHEEAFKRYVLQPPKNPPKAPTPRYALLVTPILFNTAPPVHSHKTYQLTVM